MRLTSSQPGQVVGIVVDLGVAGVEQGHAVMLLVAAQPDNRVLRPVRDAEAEDVAVERGRDLQIDALQGDMPESHRPHPTRLQRLIEPLHPFKQLNPVAVRVQVTEGRTVPRLFVRPFNRLKPLLR